MANDHYQTKHLIFKIEHNANAHCTLTEGAGRIHEEGMPEPELPGRWLRTQLNKLFGAGAYLVLETNTSWDDEGGDCYQAYIIAPEHAKEYHEERDKATMGPVDGPPPDLLFEHRYLVAHPERFWHIWAGPY